MRISKTLMLLVGIPGSGKTTWAKKNEDRAIHISRDETRFSLLKDDDEYFAKEDEVFNLWIKKIQEALDNEYDKRNFVIADATHLTPKSRSKTMNNLKFNSVIFVYFDTDLEICLERNSKRTGRELVPEETIKSMKNSLTIPLIGEHKDSVGVFIVRNGGEAILL